MIKTSGQLWVEIALIFLYNIRQRSICSLLVGLLDECRKDMRRNTHDEY